MIFVWNGKTSKGMIKATALTKGFELDRLLHENQECLEFLFNGGVIRGSKLQRGKVLIFNEANCEKVDKVDNPNTPSEEEIMRTYETVYLF